MKLSKSIYYQIYSNQKNMKKRIFIILAILALLPGVSQAYTSCGTNCFRADNASATAVQSAINAWDAANVNGVVQIPAGSATWSSSVTVATGNYNLDIVGDGVGSVTIAASISPILRITGTSGYKWTLSGITINGGTGQDIVQISGTSKNWRVHHVNFTNTGSSLMLMTVSGDTYGVADHLNISGNASSVFNIIGKGWHAWRDANYANWGDQKTVFLEDSTITYTNYNQGRFLIDCQGGGRYVIRHNNIQNIRFGNHGLDSGGYASCLSGEIYNNTVAFTSAWDAIESAMHLRGGSMLFHNNTISYSAQTWIGSPNLLLKNYRATGGISGWPACNGTQYRWNSSLSQDWTGTAMFSTSGTWKMCSGNRMRLCTSDSTCSANGEGTCSEFVDGTAGSGAYPCFQQVGRGVNNSLNPLYEWNNTWSGGEGGSACIGSCNVNFGSGSYIQAGRDFYNDTQKPGYSPYAYPHPLTGGTSVPGLSAPTNLHFSQN